MIQLTDMIKFTSHIKNFGNSCPGGIYCVNYINAAANDTETYSTCTQDD